MSLPQEGAKVATSVVDALKSQPMVLAVIVLNIVIFGAIVFAVRDQRAHEHELTKIILTKCLGDRADLEDDDVPLPRPRPADLAL